MRMIKQLEGESASRQQVMHHGLLSDLERQKYEFHLRWNAEIVEDLKRFL